jgi:hypothetical protein
MSTTKGRCRYPGCNIVFKLLKDKNFSDILTHFDRLLPFGSGFQSNINFSFSKFKSDYLHGLTRKICSIRFFS